MAPQDPRGAQAPWALTASRHTLPFAR